MTTQIKQGYPATATTTDRSTLLRRVLWLDAAMSTLCALLLIIDAGPVATFLGWGATWPVTAIGIGLLPFVALVVWTATRPQIPPMATWVIIELNVLWVVASVVLLFSPWPGLTVAGKWAVGIVADAVALCAVGQFFGLRRLTSGGMKAK